MSTILIRGATIVNEGKRQVGDIVVKDGYIEKIAESISGSYVFEKEIDAKGKLLLPGVIDDQVHFREPGLTHKGNIYTESKAAIAGGVTSFMEMPNTIPQTITREEVDKKVDTQKIPGIKVFMESSTGNMLVDNPVSLESIFKYAPTLVATHCEDEDTIKLNTIHYNKVYGENIPFHLHPQIRSTEACFISSSLAVKLAKENNTRLHILHISTAKELELLRNDISLQEKRITGEVCVHHLWFAENDYEKLGWRIKWNPAIKTEYDREALRAGLISNKLDVVATDHAPHTLDEKGNAYMKCPSGGPLVQHSLTAMIELAKKGLITLESVVEKMCHNPAILFSVEKRGFIREGYFADLVLVDPNNPWTVSTNNILYKCGWSPFEGESFSAKVTHTFVNGRLIYENGVFNETVKGKLLKFNR